MGEQKNRSKIMIRIMLIGILLWGFYVIQEEFAKYGMYQLISYGVHEISSVIPLLCILATIICAGYLTWCWIKKKADKTDRILLVVLVIREQKYLIDFVWNKKCPDKGEIHMISIVD